MPAQHHRHASQTREQSAHSERESVDMLFCRRARRVATALFALSQSVMLEKEFECCFTYLSHDRASVAVQHHGLGRLLDDDQPDGAGQRGRLPEVHPALEQASVLHFQAGDFQPGGVGVVPASGDGIKGMRQHSHFLCNEVWDVYQGRIYGDNEVFRVQK